MSSLTDREWEELPVQLDENCTAIFLSLPSSNIVLLQAHLEIYEGLGMLRTQNVKDSIVTVLTTPSALPECRMLLEALRPELQWKLISGEGKSVFS